MSSIIPNFKTHSRITIQTQTLLGILKTLLDVEFYSIRDWCVPKLNTNRKNMYSQWFIIDIVPVLKQKSMSKSLFVN